MAITLFLLFFTMLAIGLDNTIPHIALGQSAANFTSALNKTQEWTSQRDNVKILFTYQPERPIIDTFTKLEFSVINLTSNENLKNFDARVVVTNGQRLFKFENITVPDDGTHQVLTRIDKGISTRVLASFNVFVPHQAPPSILNLFPTSPGSESGDDTGILLSKILAIVLPVAGVLGLIFMIKMGKAKSRETIK